MADRYYLPIFAFLLDGKSGSAQGNQDVVFQGTQQAEVLLQNAEAVEQGVAQVATGKSAGEVARNRAFQPDGFVSIF